jgi:hypothetical protein
MVPIMQGVKSSKYGSYWKSMFMTAMCMPDKIDPKIPKHLEKVKHYKTYYDSFQHIIPCKFCRDFTKEVLMKKYPLNYDGRIELLYSIYLWKDAVNKKLIAQKCLNTKVSPPFEVILKRYEKLRAKCDKKVGKCV